MTNLVGVVCLATMVCAQPPSSRAPVRTPVMSQSFRFVCGGLDSAAHLSWVTWAEDLSLRLGQWIGADAPFVREYPLRIKLSTSEVRGGRVFPESVGEGMVMQQTLHVDNPREVLPEEAAAGLLNLLLMRYAGPLDRPLPSWFVHGLAIHLMPDLRNTYTREAIDAWSMGQMPDLETILRWPEKNSDDPLWRAGASMLVMWLSEEGRNPEWLIEITRPLPADAEASTGDGERLWPMAEGARGRQRAFDLWMASYAQTRTDPLRITRRDIRDLKLQLSVRPGLFSGPVYEEMPNQLLPAEWIPYLGEPWVAPAAQWMSVHIKSLGLGRPSAYREVVDLFGAYFDALSYPTAPTKLGRIMYPTYSKRELRKLYQTAAEALERMDKVLKQ